MTKNQKVFEFKATTLQEDGEFTGLLSPYGGPPDSQGDVIDTGAYAKDLGERGNRRPLLSGHDPTQSIGWVELADTARGLVVTKGKILLDLQQGREDYVRLKNRVITGLSIGFSTVRDKVVGGVRYLKEVRLWEASLVVFPAHEQARVEAVKDQRDGHELAAGLRAIAADVATVNVASDLRRLTEDVRSIRITPDSLAEGLRQIGDDVRRTRRALKEN